MDETLARMVVGALVGGFGGAHLDPWWWPVGTGATPEAWGSGVGPTLSPEVMASLRGVKGATLDPASSEGFCGSLGPSPESCRFCVLAARPAPGPYPDRFGGATRLVRLLRRLDMLPATHVTHIVKIRGRRDEEATIGLTERSVASSLDLLYRQLVYLDPERVLVAGELAAEWVNEGPRGLLRDHEALVAVRGRAAYVPSWTSARATPSWHAVVGGTVQVTPMPQPEIHRHLTRWLHGCVVNASQRADGFSARGFLVARAEPGALRLAVRPPVDERIRELSAVGLSATADESSAAPRVVVAVPSDLYAHQEAWLRAAARLAAAGLD